MRTAIISDIHGHFEGLSAVLSDIKEQACERILCLGDLVEGGEYDDRVIEEISCRDIICVQGNHDRDHSLCLSPKNQAFLDQLPEELLEDDVHFSHISARPKMLKISSLVEAWNVFDEAPHRLMFTGHQHLPLIYGEKSEVFGQATAKHFTYNQAFQFETTDRYIICVGSVAYGRDSVGKLRYAIYDSKLDSVEHRVVEGPLLARDYTLKSSSTS